MLLRSTAAALLLIPAFNTLLAAEPLPEDDLLTAVNQAGKALAEGKNRQDIADGLQQAVQQNSKSRFSGIAQTLQTDLTTSILKSAKGTDGNPTLMETRMPIYVLSQSVNWEGMPTYLKKYPDDPLSEILRQDRRVIETLLPLLRDRSPTRSYSVMRFSGDLPIVPRVCDVAMLTIEHFSQCRFHFNAFTHKLFHELSQEERNKTILHLEKWWQENKDKSLADGIRAQLPYAEFYEKLAMADNLAHLGDGMADSPERVDGMHTLRMLAQENWGPKAARAAALLARLDDLSAVDDFYARWAKPGNEQKLIDFHIAAFLLNHGSRREWEFVYHLAKQEIGLEAGSARLWPLLVNSRMSRRTPLAIPGVALVLTKTRLSGSRFVKGVGSQEFSYADTAAECLQTLTGMDFGYRIDGTSQERSRAIEKAQAWWNNEGREKYKFDAIESRLK